MAWSFQAIDATMISLLRIIDGVEADEGPRNNPQNLTHWLISTQAWMAQCARLVAQHDQPVSWITPLGLPVVQPYRRDGQHAVRTLAQTVVLVDHSDKLPVSVTKQKSAFPPNYVHSLDSTHMLMTANEMDHRGLRFAAVHDSYWTHACDVPVMNDTLRRQFLALYEEPLLEQLLESFQLRYPGVEFPLLPPRGDLDVTEVLAADYFFS